ANLRSTRILMRAAGRLGNLVVSALYAEAGDSCCAPPRPFNHLAPASDTGDSGVPSRNLTTDSVRSVRPDPVPPQVGIQGRPTDAKLLGDPGEIAPIQRECLRDDLSLEPLDGC